LTFVFLTSVLTLVYHLAHSIVMPPCKQFWDPKLYCSQTNLFICEAW